MANSNEIEDEMSRFEAELCKMESSSKPNNSAPSKHKISIQMPTSLPSGSVNYYEAAENAASSSQQYIQAYQTGSVLQKIPPPPSTGLKQASKRDFLGGAKLGTSSGSAEADGRNKRLKISKEKKEKKIVRCAGGQIWEDNSLADWDPDDFRLFCGDLGNEVTDDALARAFQKYTSFQRAKVIRDKRTGKSKGYGFVSFKSSEDFIKAMREMNGKYVGNRPIKLRKSTWKERNIEIVKKKEREKQRMGLK
ncbi:RNA-binding 42 [Brachionus plicatilis]|uniref:RNA-binding protein 42 n=1 Tax=Brachionus plicatilis TaxID=10195 RepID=A0A3M7PM91_BRAPC|nr:RNA-binding 42 [Brachionus plicatilis]